jgi:hypothetical protein
MGDKVGSAIVKEEHTIKKRILPQNTVFSFSAEQSATQDSDNNWHKIVIITDSLSTIMAAESRTSTKNPKTKNIRKMLDHEGPRITLLFTREYQKMKRPTRQREKPWTRTSQPLKDTRQTTWRNGWPKKTSKKETKDGKTETTRWKKERLHQSPVFCFCIQLSQTFYHLFKKLK